MRYFRRVKQMALEQQLEALREEYDALNHQLMRTLEDDRRLRLGRQLQDLGAVMVAIEGELGALESDDAASLFSQATRAYIDGDIAHALQLYRRIQRSQPDYPRIDAHIREAEQELTARYVDRAGRVRKTDFLARTQSPRALLRVVLLIGVLLGLLGFLYLQLQARGAFGIAPAPMPTLFAAVQSSGPLTATISTGTIPIRMAPACPIRRVASGRRA